MAKSVYQAAADSGDDWSTLQGALAVATAGETITISGGWTVDDTAACTVADNNITITATGDARNNGYVEGRGATAALPYRLVVSGSNHNITVNNTGCTIDGIIICSTSTTSSQEGIRISSGVTATVKNCILFSTTATADKDGIYAGDYSATVNVENCILYKWARAGLHPQMFSGNGSTQTWNINSCTIWDCGGDDTSADDGGIAVTTEATDTANMNIFNTISISNDGDSAKDYTEATSGTVTWDIENCIDGDNSISLRIDNGSNNLASRTATDNTSPAGGDWVVFEDITSADYDLRIVDSADVTAETNDAFEMHTVSSPTHTGLTMPTLDILGNTRDSSYDCGAHEKSFAAGGSIIPQIMHHRTTQVSN